MAFLGFGKKDTSHTHKAETEKIKEKVEKKPIVKSALKKEVKKITTKKVATKKTLLKKTPNEKVVTTTSATDYSNVLIKPRITEKATIIAEEGGVYTFNVHPDATKKEISKAIENNFKVIPVKVNVITLKRKKVFRRGKRGITGGGKKAMVYLKEGDSIEFV